MTEVRTRTRWRHVDGDVLDCFDRKVTLTDAIGQFEAWGRLAVESRDRGDLLVAQVYMRDALALSLPTSLAFNWRRAHGWPDPFDTERDRA